MSSAAWRSNIAQMAQLAAQGVLTARWCTVSTPHSTDYAVKVFVEPEHIESDYIPVLTPFVGNGWGMFCKPNAGDQVLVVYAEGDINAGAVVGGIYSDVDQPLPAPEGEFWLVHKQGQFVKLLNDGSIHVQTDANTYLVLAAGGGITSKGTWNHDGPFTATGEGTFNGGHTVSQHTHTQPADSHGDTEQPTNKPTG